MKARIVWADPVRDLLLELSPREQRLILEKVDMLARFPFMYPLREKSKRFRRHRWFTAGNWLVYYRRGVRRGLHPRIVACTDSLASRRCLHLPTR